MGGQEGRRVLAERRLDVGVVAGPQHGHEEVGGAQLAAFRIDDRKGVAGPVDEQLLAGLVLAAHDHVDLGRPAAVALAEPAVLIALRVGVLVLAPEQHQGHVLARQLRAHVLPVGLAHIDGDLALGAIEAPLQGGFAEPLRQRPGKPRGL